MSIDEESCDEQLTEKIIYVPEWNGHIKIRELTRDECIQLLLREYGGCAD